MHFEKGQLMIINWLIFLDCGSGYQFNGGFCYKLVTVRKSWYDAEDYCELEGGHLTSILNYNEANFIRSKYIILTNAWGNQLISAYY